LIKSLINRKKAARQAAFFLYLPLPPCPLDLTPPSPCIVRPHPALSLKERETQYLILWDNVSCRGAKRLSEKVNELFR
jgi:hypothetical protein